LWQLPCVLPKVSDGPDRSEPRRSSWVDQMHQSRCRSFRIRTRAGDRELMGAGFRFGGVMIDVDAASIEVSDPPVEYRDRLARRKAPVERRLSALQENRSVRTFPSEPQGDRAGGQTVGVGVRTYEGALAQQRSSSCEHLGIQNVSTFPAGRLSRACPRGGG
jgi:hypothetical protein